MSRIWAKVIDGEVVDLIVAEEDHIQSGIVGDPSLWIESPRDGEGPVHRVNEAGVGFTYNYEHDKFIPGQPFPSWTLNTENWNWYPPVEPPPYKGCHKWDEDTQTWIEGQQFDGCS